MDEKYNLLFYFESGEISILEIKINGINTTDKSKIYHWLLYLKKDKELIPLFFKKMGKINEKEFRDFKDSRLEFDNRIASFTKGNISYRLDKISHPTELEQSLKEQIDAYIFNLNTDM